MLQKISKKLDFKCIYILLDRIDENSLTGNKASNSYQFIKPLLTDIHTLELPGFSFKFFLWDTLLDDYRNDGRPDRVKSYPLSWSLAQLKEMLSKRLQAYSGKTIHSFDDICETNSEDSIDDIIVLFSQESPRNIIRICKHILDQQSEVNSAASKISQAAITKGIHEFCNEYTQEILNENIIKELKKAKRTDFTVKYIYNTIFKISHAAGIAKIKTWLDTGCVIQLGKIQETEGARTSHHYGIINIIVAKHIFPIYPFLIF